MASGDFPTTMNRTDATQEPPLRGTIGQRVAGRWVLGSLAGLLLALGIFHMLTPRLPDPGPRLVIAALLGWIGTLGLAPWVDHVRLSVHDHALRRLTRALATGRAAEAQGESVSFDRLIDHATEEADPTVIQLAREITAALYDVHQSRSATRRLERTMHDEIRRETDRATRRLRREATTDPLTGLANRRGMEAAFERLCGGPPLTAMAIDLDGFKPLNDTVGHEAGDACLRAVGDLLRSALRREDFPVRLGGDEFLVLMPGAGRETAQRVGERLRHLLAQVSWPYAPAPRPTLSIGIATPLPGERTDPVDLIRRADEALYTAKRTGRNRVVAA